MRAYLLCAYIRICIKYMRAYLYIQSIFIFFSIYTHASFKIEIIIYMYSLEKY